MNKHSITIFLIFNCPCVLLILTMLLFATIGYRYHRTKSLVEWRIAFKSYPNTLKIKYEKKLSILGVLN